MKKTLISILLVLCLSVSSHAADVLLSWEYPDEIANVDGFRIFISKVDESYDYCNPTWTGTDTHAKISGLEANAAYKVICTAFKYINESVSSEEITFNVNTADVVMPPSNFMIRSITIGF